MFKKKIKRLLLSIIERIESFFNYLEKLKKIKIKKNITIIDKKNFIIVGIILTFIIVYFLIPAFYNKQKLSAEIKNQLLEKYNLEVKFENPLKYSFLPKPHFYTKDTILIFKEENIARSSLTKVYLSSKNFFSLKKISIKDIKFKQTNFNIKYNNLLFFKNLLNSNKSEHKINFVNSKLFYIDKNEEVVFFSYIKNLDFLYNEKFAQELLAKLKIFNTSLKLNIVNNLQEKKTSTKINSHKLRLNIENNFEYNDKSKKGVLKFKIFNKSIKIKYKLNNNSLVFNSDKSNILGDINFKPFYLSTSVRLEQLDVLKILKNDSILINIFNSELLSNQNLNAKVDIYSKSIRGIKYLNNIKLKAYFEEGNILIKDSNINWKDSVNINLENIKLTNQNGKIIIAGVISFDFIDLNSFYRHYQIVKVDRKKIEKIKLNFDYNLNENKIDINNLKTDGAKSKIIDNFLINFNIKKKDLSSNVVFKNLIKEFFSIL